VARTGRDTAYFSVTLACCIPLFGITMLYTPRVGTLTPRVRKATLVSCPFLFRLFKSSGRFLSTFPTASPKSSHASSRSWSSRVGSMGEYTVDFQSCSSNMHTVCRHFSGLSCFNLSPVLMERWKSSLFQRGETGCGQMRNRSGFLRLHLNPQTSAVQAVWIYRVLLYRVLCCHGSGGQW
jgi:hypothetical protein